MIRYLLILIFFTAPLCAEEGKFLLLLGPSGVGKSTIIRHLKEMDSRFVYVSPYTTRELRPGETDKVHVSLEAIQQLEQEGKLLTVNVIYGIYYATPKEVIDMALSEGNIPILDWPVSNMDVMLDNYGPNLLTVYVEPESLDELERRLANDGRDREGKRFAAGKEELLRYYSGEFDSLIHLKILNRQGEDLEVASRIYEIVTQ